MAGIYIAHSARLCVSKGPPYVQDWSAQNFAQDAGLIGRGCHFARPDFFFLNATETRGGVGWLPLPTSSPPKGWGSGSGWSGPTCKVAVDRTRPARSFVPTSSAHEANNYGIGKRKTKQVSPLVVLKPTQASGISRSVEQQRKERAFRT